jgi:hypothetical protein
MESYGNALKSTNSHNYGFLVRVFGQIVAKSNSNDHEQVNHNTTSPMNISLPRLPETEYNYLYKYELGKQNTRNHTSDR